MCSEDFAQFLFLSINKITAASRNVKCIACIPFFLLLLFSSMAAYIVTTRLHQSKIKWHDKSRAYRSLRNRSSCRSAQIISQFTFCFFIWWKNKECKKAKILTMIKCILAADAMCFWITSFRKMISVSFIVISSSFLELYSIGYSKYSKSRMKHKHKQTNEKTHTQIICTHVHMQTRA